MDDIVKEHNLKGDMVDSDNIRNAGKSQEDHDDNLYKFNSVS